MPLTCSMMLDFTTLKTPPKHGDVLITPDPNALPSAVQHNHQSLSQATTIIAGQTLAHWRSQTRQKFVGNDEDFIIVTGHQPDFIHPGVWAKHVVSARLAKALRGMVVNLVVDSDVVKRRSLPVPVERDGRVTLKRLPYTHAGKALSYEQIPKLSDEQIDTFASLARETIGRNYQQSQWPAFLSGIRQAKDANDWVDQAVAGRREIEAGYGISVLDTRVSAHWCTPFVVDMLLNARTFAASYNRALKTYRKENKISGHSRPIPDLLVSDDRCEVALWAHTADAPRQRLFVTTDDNQVHLFADETLIANLPLTTLRSHQCSACKELAAHLQQSGWELRHRALTLTLWARLLLADLFIHGIGGAKYDRITDSIMRDYYNIEAPTMACVSATLHLPLPTHKANAAHLHRLYRDARDWQYNPHLALIDQPSTKELLATRQALITQSQQLRTTSPKDHRARRKVFDDLRQLNARLQQLQPERQAAIDTQITQTRQAILENEIAKGREYFFGLYDTAALRQLLAALPAEQDFAV